MHIPKGVVDPNEFTSEVYIDFLESSLFSESIFTLDNIRVIGYNDERVGH